MFNIRVLYPLRVKVMNLYTSVVKVQKILPNCLA